jgi:hypothetical protein
MFKSLIEKIKDCMFTTYDIEIDFEITRLFIGIVLGFILATALAVSYI